MLLLLTKFKNGLVNLWKAFNDAFTTAGAKLAVIFGVVISLLLFYLKQKNKEVAALQAQANMLQTQKAADALQSTITAKLQDNTLLQQQIDGYNSILATIEQKRKTLPESNPDDVVKYWDNN